MEGEKAAGTSAGICQGCPAGVALAVHDKMEETILSFLPPEVRDHLLGARKEMLMAARSMIDHALERVDQKQTKASQKITVE